MDERKIIILDDALAVHVRAAEEIAHIAGEAICMHGNFTICLAGGATPAATYELLATRFRLSVDWKEVEFFWGDERCVPPNHEASNYGMANRLMLVKLALKPAQIHRIRGEEPPEKAAQAYAEDIGEFFSLADGEFPRFELILLGLGENAHTASLFPGSPAIHEARRIAVALQAEAAQPNRVSLTPPVFNNAAHVMFLVCGPAKAPAVKNVLEGPKDPDRFPAQIIAPRDGEVLWLLDKAAASMLSAR
jgi:6-phosphogluconolactonase